MAIQTPPAAPGEYLTLDEFLSADDGIAAEWVDGKVYPMTPVTNRHQNIVDFLGTLLRELVEETDAGIIRTSRLAMRIDNSLRVPDLLFLAAEYTRASGSDLLESEVPWRAAASRRMAVAGEVSQNPQDLARMGMK